MTPPYTAAQMQLLAYQWIQNYIFNHGTHSLPNYPNYNPQEDDS